MHNRDFHRNDRDDAVRAVQGRIWRDWDDRGADEYREAKQAVFWAWENRFLIFKNLIEK